ncbi:hypothetical protein CROQUDRAFT_47284 [Cronartium quercuum f. sp. fusiforme G11]|uniref:Spindle pole body component n=1 Tax=Cronartium quercuum f. sp. fusiforme G11 TaxID=708437 RepID=A0A9P6NI03_9BASI|nr:hypothetical protein CROQUDRAFT_47284 [Cronartium quercuum f. sp. fusiforme G11]
MRFKEPKGFIITLPQRHLILKLSELGYLFKRIELNCNEQLKVGGMIVQAFVHSLKDELSLYYRVIANIESKLSLNQLTLKSLLLHLNPTLLRLRISSTLLTITQNSIGGKLVNVLDSYTNHGDPIVYKYISNLLEKVLVPWFNTLTNWIWDGELLDPNQEFFISLNLDNEQNQDEHWNHEDSKIDLGWKIWESKFKFREEMVPSFINLGFARKIYSTGKSINFIKYSCSETDWQQTRASLFKISEKVTLHYSDIAGLETNINLANLIASKQIFTIFFHKLKLLEHLKALKDYLLLGRGDFISLLIESLGPSLNKPASSLYRHNLTSTLESAIKLTSNNPTTDLINRLDVRMLEFESNDLGWDVFMLEYKTETPLDVILSQKAMEKYMKMFRMIWRIKRVEYVIELGWKILMVGCRNREIDDQLKNDYHKSRIVVSEMVHFIRQLCSFVQLEVIECGWQSFESTVMVDGGDLDSLVEAHRVYLDRLVSKGMLLNPKKVGKENACLLLAEDCFKVILSYKASIDSLHAYALSETQQVGQLDDIRRRMSSQAKNFTDLVLDLISALTAQPDPDLRFLSVRLNFSLFYLRTKTSGGTSGKTQQNRK